MEIRDRVDEVCQALQDLGHAPLSSNARDAIARIVADAEAKPRPADKLRALARMWKGASL